VAFTCRTFKEFSQIVNPNLGWRPAEIRTQPIGSDVSNQAII
jgi:hypothetical protein